jgi:predicted DNA-binding protein (UPF0251 family)
MINTPHCGVQEEERKASRAVHAGRKRDLEGPFNLTAKESEALSLELLGPEEAAQRMRIKVKSYRHLLLTAREKMRTNFTKAKS